jgi:hypothetical protein
MHFFTQDIWLLKIDGQQKATKLGVLIGFVTFWWCNDEEHLLQSCKQ